MLTPTPAPMLKKPKIFWFKKSFINLLVEDWLPTYINVNNKKHVCETAEAYLLVLDSMKDFE